MAVDGGGVKTDLALLDSSGALLSLVRGGRSQAHYLGVDGSVEVLEGLLAAAVARAGLDPLERPFAATAQLLLAGVDLPGGAGRAPCRDGAAGTGASGS